jgi:hypothetical protein
MGEPVQLDKAEYVDTTKTTCAFCRQPIQTDYYAVNDKVTCPRCHASLQQRLAPGSVGGRSARALALGLAAAVVGGLAYFAIRVLTHLNIGLVAIGVGWLVGRAVRRGAGAAGGPAHQALAVGLTYLACAFGFAPYLAGKPFDAAFLAKLLLMPVTAVSSPIGYLILGYALYEAWRLNQRPALRVSGPLRVSPARAVAPAPEGEAGNG